MPLHTVDNASVVAYFLMIILVLCEWNKKPSDTRSDPAYSYEFWYYLSLRHPGIETRNFYMKDNSAPFDLLWLIQFLKKFNVSLLYLHK